MLTNINPYSNALANITNTSNSTASTGTTANSAVDKVIEDYNQSQAAKTEPAATTETNLYLSSRSQKISALSSEFFSGGGLAVSDIDALKERAYQLGLISQGDYQRLTNAETTATSRNENEGTSTTTLANYIGDFIERLDKSATDETKDNEADSADEEGYQSETIKGLKEALNVAKALFENIDQAKKQDDFKSTLSSAIAFLKETISDDAFNAMPTDDKIGLSKVYQALEIVDKITPQRLTNDKINRYIELSFE